MPNSTLVQPTPEASSLQLKRPPANPTLDDTLRVSKYLKQQGRDEIRDGRVRVFPHVAGVWASHVYIPIVPGELFDDMVEDLVATVNEWAGDHAAGANISRCVSDACHVSLSRTLQLQQHDILPLVQQVQVQLRGKRAVRFAFGSLATYSNEQGTRAFLALKVSKGLHGLRQLVEQVDIAVGSLGHPRFYASRDLHLSVLSWTADADVSLGADETDRCHPSCDEAGAGAAGEGERSPQASGLLMLDNVVMKSLSSVLEQYRHDPDTGLDCVATRVTVKCGNKIYDTPLENAQS